MTRRRPLPLDLGNGPFAVSVARDHGVSASRLRATDLESPTRGVRSLVGPAAEPLDLTQETATQRMIRLYEDMCARARAFAPALTPAQFFSHDTGLGLIGAPLPYSTSAQLDLHVSVRRPAPQPERKGVTAHRLQTREAARWTIKDLPIEHPARMWRQVAASWSLDDLIAAGDFLVHPRNGLMTIDDLWAEVHDAGDVRGMLRRALLEIREGAESPRETALRLAITRAGLPQPELNWNLHDDAGRFIARLDIAYPRYRVAAEYDGRQHAEEVQFDKDADRWDDIRTHDWTLVRVLSHHLHPDPQPAIDKVAQALIAADWRPGRR